MASWPDDLRVISLAMQNNKNYLSLCLSVLIKVIEAAY